MDIEQLKLILEAAAAAGSGAYNVVLLWFGYQLITDLLFSSLFAAAIWCAYRLIKMGIEYDTFQEQVRGIVNIDMSYSADRKRVTDWIRKQIAQHPID